MKKIIILNIIVLILSACSTSNVSNKQKESKENLARQKFGIEVANLTQEIIKESGLSHGVVITNIYSLYPANKAGILKGDIILKIDNKNVLDLHNLKIIMKTYKYKYGQVSMNIFRNKKIEKINLHLE